MLCSKREHLFGKPTTTWGRTPDFETPPHVFGQPLSLFSWMGPNGKPTLQTVCVCANQDEQKQRVEGAVFLAGRPFFRGGIP